MPHYDIFNGDADGICALHQLRLHTPKESTLITGVKRQIRLLQKIEDVCNATLTVLDISMDSNKSELLQLLAQNNHVEYYDHHFPGDIPETPHLTAHIQTQSTICTSLIVDEVLQGKHRPWAIVAAFGDNMHAVAEEAAKKEGWTPEQTQKAKTLGILLNYNGYGETEADLHLPPQKLYQAVSPYEDPFDFFENAAESHLLQEGYAKDKAQSEAATVLHENEQIRIFEFPAAAWARRTSGTFINEMAQASPTQGHALLTQKDNGHYLVSVRAPLNKPQGADEICKHFPTGGGRKGAGGINELPKDQVPQLKTLMESYFG